MYAGRMIQEVAALLLAVLFLLQVAPGPQKPAEKGAASHRPDRLLQSGHTRVIQALALSSDGRWIASGGYDKTVIVWNVATGDEQWRFGGHADTIVGLAF